MISDRAIDRLREAAAWPELDARYAITGVAGRGGMGTVYVARDHVLDRDVAVKVLDVADQKGSRAARLQREAHILARLDHPGIVPVHDAGELPDGRTFYVMKLVKGRRLDDLVAQNASLSDRLNAFGRVLDAVGFAHAHDVVHRDLKPENVMVGGFGEFVDAHPTAGRLLEEEFGPEPMALARLLGAAEELLPDLDHEVPKPRLGGGEERARAVEPDPAPGRGVVLEAERADTEPKVFTHVKLIYRLKGRNLKPASVERAIKLSEEKYCSATAMFAKTAKIEHEWTVEEA